MSPSVLDTTSAAGARADRRLHGDIVIWLTTVSPRAIPQASPVWFLWDGEGLLLWSKPDTAKVRNIATHPMVSVHLDGNGRGGDIVTMEARAERIDGAVPGESVDRYLDKYAQQITRIGLDRERMLQVYSVPYRITPVRARIW
jgi:PPOX class probable F420-dependent enzyme